METAGSSASLSLWIVPSGGSTAAGKAIALAVALSANTAVQEAGGLDNPIAVLEEGDSLVAAAPSGAVTISGVYFA